MKFMPFKIISVKNGESPEKEYVYLKATTPVNTKNYALVDFTFDGEGNMTNEFRHIYVFPEIELATGEHVVLCSGNGIDEIKQFKNTEIDYVALHWGVKSCVWNDNGGDKATLIKFDIVNSKDVSAVEKNN